MVLCMAILIAYSGVIFSLPNLQGKVVQARSQWLHHSCESLLLAACCVSGLLLHWFSMQKKSREETAFHAMQVEPVAA